MQKKSDVRKRAARTGLGAKEKRRLTQLVLCAGIFLVVLLGKGLRPDGGLDTELLRSIRANTDFKEAFSVLGEAAAGREPAVQTLQKLIPALLGDAEPQDVRRGAELEQGAAVRFAMEEMSRIPTAEEMLGQLGRTRETGSEATASAEPQTEAAEDKPIPEYNGPELPEGATMEYLDLGLEETVTPVSGTVSSVFGYREHPVSGEYSFHSGVDLAVDRNTPVKAFAAGTVEFIGESEAYGLYIQLDHGNGVSTFYCHCSDLYVPKGERVSAGQVIAASGDSGNATGPHLHLELKRDGVLLNPLYYIDAQG